MGERICSVEGCGRIHKARDLCSLHYQREFRSAYKQSYYQRPDVKPQYRARARRRLRARRARERERYQRRRAEAIEALGGRCVACDSTEDLHFDHIDPRTKRYGMNVLFRAHSAATVAAELAKCQLLCRSCHSRKTMTDDRRLRA